ncbi:MAG: universal stress protein [Halodesulfurarchaeum sp.]
MYRHILVPTDGSEGSERAIREAVNLAELTGGTVHGLYVIDTRDYNVLPESKWLTIEDEFTEEAERALGTIRKTAEAATVHVTTALARGVPAEEILDYVEENDVDLIVMGTHGRTGLNRVLVGSVTERVIRRATVPIHIVRLAEGE